MNVRPLSKLAASYQTVSRLLDDLGGWESIYREHPELSPSDWDNMPLGEVMERLEGYLRPIAAERDTSSLNKADSWIVKRLKQLPGDTFYSAKEIADDESDFSESYLAKRLGPKFPLSLGGFIEKRPGKDGYRLAP